MDQEMKNESDDTFSSMKSKNIVNDVNSFSWNQCDAGEVILLISTILGSGRESHEDPKNLLFPAHEPWKIELRLNRQKRIRVVNASLALTLSDWESLKPELKSLISNEGETAVGRSILFSRSPLDGYFRFKDGIHDFQILPVPDHAPTLKQIAGLHPFLLEFSFNAPSHPLVRKNRRERLSYKYETILSCLLGSSIHSVQFNDFVWGTSLFSEFAEGVSPPYVAFMTGYHFDGLLCESKSFSEVRVPPLKLLNPEKFYSEDKMACGTTLFGVTTLSDMLKAFSSLSDEDVNKFLVACSLLHKSSLVWPLSQGLAYVSICSAIEALFDKYEKIKCEHCDQTLGNSITSVFTDFIKKYAGYGEQLNGDLRQLYNLRSKLVHGSDILEFDRRGNAAIWLHGYGQNHSQHRHFSLIARKCVANWLMDKQNKT